MRGVRFNIIESRIEYRSVSTNEAGWDLEIPISDRRVESRGVSTNERCEDK